MAFKYPLILWALLILPLFFYLMLKMDKKNSLAVSFFSFFPQEKTFRVRLLYISRGFLLGSIAFLIIALARPQKGYIEDRIITEGIDIILTIDISSSMKAEDFKPNRLGAAKKVAKDFIRGRKTDKIGLVVFSRKAITQSPLTMDYGMLYEFIDGIEIGMIQDGTAIGNAIAEGAKRLSRGEEKSKVIILLTDGVNNAGEIAPLTAAKAARALDIKIYTIGVGTMGNAPYPVDDPAFGKRYVSVHVQIDEGVLLEIAALTGGRYFRATDMEKLEQIYREIDAMEKSKIEIKQFRKIREWFHYPLGAALIFLLINAVVTRLVLRVTP